VKDIFLTSVAAAEYGGAAEWEPTVDAEPATQRLSGRKRNLNAASRVVRPQAVLAAGALGVTRHPIDCAKRVEHRDHGWP
jgi:hypothetical protein